MDSAACGRGACHADLHELCVLGVVDAQAENRGDHEGGEDDWPVWQKVSGAVGLHHSFSTRFRAFCFG